MMTPKRIHLPLSILIIGVLLTIGCSDDDNPLTNGDNPSVTILSVYPADGATGISTSASVAVAFSDPVDTASVTQNLFLAGGQPMQIWRDSLMHYGGFSSMHMGMQDHMMNWLDSIEISGEFYWNAALDSCEFTPDSGFAPGTDYLCLIRETQIHDSLGGMIGGTHQTENGFHTYEFMTGP